MEADGAQATASTAQERRGHRAGETRGQAGAHPGRSSWRGHPTVPGVCRQPIAKACGPTHHKALDTSTQREAGVGEEALDEGIDTPPGNCSDQTATESPEHDEGGCPPGPDESLACREAASDACRADPRGEGSDESQAQEQRERRVPRPGHREHQDAAEQPCKQTRHGSARRSRGPAGGHETAGATQAQDGPGPLLARVASQASQSLCRAELMKLLSRLTTTILGRCPRAPSIPRSRPKGRGAGPVRRPPPPSGCHGDRPRPAPRPGRLSGVAEPLSCRADEAPQPPHDDHPGTLPLSRSEAIQWVHEGVQAPIIRFGSRRCLVAHPRSRAAVAIVLFGHGADE